MKKTIKIITGLVILMAIVISGCSNNSGNRKVKELETLESETGEHSRDVGEKGEGEESGTQFGLNDIYDSVRNGAHMILRYDADNNIFKGTVENTTMEVLKKVRVEVHLSNGMELGPTNAVDLKPGEKIEVKLDGSEKDFETWSTHAEVGENEHSHEGGEGEHSHEGEGEGEHGGEKEGETNS